MLSRTDLSALKTHQGYPCVSILALTHRTAPANKQDPIKVKNLVTKAIDRLNSEFKKREIAPVVANLKSLVKELDWNYLLNGLALFASHEHASCVTVPFPLKSRIIIDHNFATRDLIYAYNRAQPYRVLTVSHQSRLYDAWTSTLDEHTGSDFPIIHKGPGGASKLPGGEGINPSAKRDHAMRAYCRQIDEVLAGIHKADPRPIILVGVERNLAFFKEVSRHNDAIIGMLTGNHEQTPHLKLGKLVLPIFEAADASRRTDALVQLDDAVSANRHASGIQQVWRAVAEHRVQTLLVEKAFKYPTDVSPDGLTLTKYTGGGPEALDDAVDELIERVFADGGKVHFYPPGDLDTHQRIAAILQW